MASTVHLRSGSLFITLKAYFDKSGQDDQALLTIGGIAGGDEVWGKIENDWKAILKDHDPPAAYMHMVEAIPLRCEFRPDKGWNDDKVFGLVNTLLSYLSEVPDKTKYCHFACTLKMDDYRKLQAENYQMDAPADLLASLCAQRITEWYFFEYKGIDLEATHVFDQNEPFEPIIKAKWERETENSRLTGNYNAWCHIAEVGTAIMRKTPGLQVADMFAWATNRHEVKVPQRYSDLAIAMRSLIPTIFIVIDETQLRRQYRPFNP